MITDIDPSLMPPLAASAGFSPCRDYRYALSRSWDSGRPSVAFIMLNPSTADAFVLDPTIRRCIGFAKAWGYGGIEVRNLFAFRATKPEDMRTAADPVGPENDEAIRQVLGLPIVAAWGCDGKHLGRASAVLKILANANVTCLRRTNDGHPSHPLYLKADLVPVPFKD